MPKDVVFPAIGDVRLADEKVNLVGKAGGSPGLTKQLQPRLRRTAVAFPAVAFDAAGHDILPGLQAFACHRNDMVVGQLAEVWPQAAVLASIPVAGVQVRSGEPDSIVAVSNLHILTQSQNGRQSNTDRNTVDPTVVFSDYFDLPLKEHTKRTLPGNNLQGLVGSIQDKCVFQGSRSDPFLPGDLTFEYPGTGIGIAFL